MTRVLIRYTAVAAVFFCSVLAAGEDRSSGLFQAGDRWAVIGDSITHGRRYHSFIYLFYATRFPAAKFMLYNCGISGDSAGGAVRRFPWDIAVHKPTVATVMLGMNDVSRGLYGKDKSGEVIETRRKNAIDSYVGNMDQLAGLLAAGGTRIVFLTPSIYDQTGNQKTENCFGVNDALGICGERVRDLAQKYAASVIDLHTPMTALNSQIQERDPGGTLVGPDRVHPGDAGQFVMAYLFLRGQNVPGLVSEAGIDAGSGLVTSVVNCDVSEITTEAGGVAFDLLEHALPFPVPDIAKEALDWVPFMNEMNREVIHVTGLVPGKFTLLIDGEVCAIEEAASFAQGIDLAANERTPMYRQALDVAALNEKRHSIEGGKLRTLAAQRHWLCRRHPDLDPENYEAMKAVLLAGLEAQKGASNYGYFKGQAEAYIKYKPMETELRGELAETTDAIWEDNQPRPHHVQVIPATNEHAAELAGLILDDFTVYAGWTFTGWTDTEPSITAADGVLTVIVPRREGVRDMLGLSKRISVDLSTVSHLRVRLRGTPGAHFGIEMVIDGALKRLASYLQTSGEWQEMDFAVAGKGASSITLILAEPGATVKCPEGKVSYEFDRLWLE